MPWSSIVVRRARKAKRPAPTIMAYTMHDIASMLGVHYDSVRRWVRRGEMRAMKLGKGPPGSVRITRADLEDFMRRNSTWKVPG